MRPAEAHFDPTIANGLARMHDHREGTGSNIKAVCDQNWLTYAACALSHPRPAAGPSRQVRQWRSGAWQLNQTTAAPRRVRGGARLVLQVRGCTGGRAGVRPVHNEVGGHRCTFHTLSYKTPRRRDCEQRDRGRHICRASRRWYTRACRTTW